MSDTNEQDETAGEAADAAEPPRSRRKLLVIIAAALLLLAGGGGAAWFFLSGSGDEHAADAVAEIPETFVDVEPMQVNLRTADGSSRFLKVHVKLVPGTLDAEAITARLPLVVDSYQPFLRELRPEDIAGSAATFRLKEEMLVRANDVLGKGSVKDVLIQDLVQQ